MTILRFVIHPITQTPPRTSGVYRYTGENAKRIVWANTGRSIEFFQKETAVSSEHTRRPRNLDDLDERIWQPARSFDGDTRFRTAHHTKAASQFDTLSILNKSLIEAKVLSLPVADIEVTCTATLCS